MRIEKILSVRSHLKTFFWPVVFEWEDVLAQELGVKIGNNIYSEGRIFKGLMRRFPNLVGFLKTRRPALSFVMHAAYDWSCRNRLVVPCIIDFYLRDRRSLQLFYKNCEKCPVVLISSAEAFEFLKSSGCQLNMRHWGLSIADKWVEMPAEPKSYDLAIIGRTNSMLAKWAHRYADEHPDFTVIQTFKEDGHFVCRDWRGNLVSGADSREQYMSLLRMARAALWSTPSIDDRPAWQNGFDQVTPRLLEAMASRCHVLARYPDNADTRYYALSDVVPHLGTYEQFASAMDAVKGRPVNPELYRGYLANHVTSARARELREILEGI